MSLLIYLCVSTGCTAALDFDALQKSTKSDEAQGSASDSDSDLEFESDTTSLPTECINDSSCDDGIDCTNDRCSARGVCVQEPSNSLCPGFEVCKIEQGCVDIGRECLTEADCDDGIDCTRNSCSSGGKCEVLFADDTVCEDPDNLCLFGKTCDPVDGCIGGFENHCAQDDGPSCYNNVCSPVTGRCDDRVFRPGADKDGDGYCNDDPVFGGDDCNDELNTVYPGALEIENQRDDDCDGLTDNLVSP